MKPIKNNLSRVWFLGMAWSRILRRKWSQFSIIVLRLLLRLSPNESQRMFGLTVVIGIVCGLAAVAFHFAIVTSESFLIQRAVSSTGLSQVLGLLGLSVLGGMCCGLFLQYFVPEARGSGIPQVKVAYSIKGGVIPLKTVVGKFILGSIQIGSGASLGREGPTVQICAGISSFLGRMAALSPGKLPRLLPVAAAAGVAAAFNAPIAAVTFSIEEIVGDLDQTILSGIVVAAALAAVIEHSLLGEHAIFLIPQGYGLHHISSLATYAVLGVCAGMAATIFCDLLLGFRSFFQNLRWVPEWVKPGIGGLMTGALALLALRWLHTEGVTGGGYRTLSEALNGKLGLQVLLILFILKILATVFSYSSGGVGGIFAPVLFIGAMLGGIFGHLDALVFHHSINDVGAFALVGMGAVFAGVIRTPITSVLIIFEMTGGYDLVLPLMIANSISFLLARHWRHLPIYEALLEQDSIILPHHRTATHPLKELRVSQAMTTKVISLRAAMPLTEALEYISMYSHPVFPVLDETGSVVGAVQEATMRQHLAKEATGTATIESITIPITTCFPDYELVRAAIIMGESNTHQVAVVRREDNRRLVGWLSMSDVIEAQAKVATQGGEIGRSIIPD
ncbi:MAG: chloride channel protein [Blastocatellia bacterium]|nr:chloride channel protein [Blastocatellia bacterium]